MTRYCKVEEIIAPALALSENQTSSECLLNYVLYLTDWLHACKTGLQLSDVRWVRGPHGPCAPEIHQSAVHSSSIKMVNGNTADRSTIRYSLVNGAATEQLPGSATAALKATARLVKGLPLEEIQAIACDTRPMKSGAEAEALDLELHAREIRLGEAERFADDVLPGYSDLLRALSR